jgi:hypothetical protein
MSQASDVLENAILDHLFRGATYAKPTNLYFALFTAAPNDAGGGTEVSGGSYARVTVAPSNSNFNGTHGSTSGASSGMSGQITNAVAITWPAPTANWGTCNAFGIFDAATVGNLLIWGMLNTAKTVNNGDSAPSFSPGNFQVTLA